MNGFLAILSANNALERRKRRLDMSFPKRRRDVVFNQPYPDDKEFPQTVYRDPKRHRPYEFPGRGTKFVLYLLVKLYDLGYTPVPVFDRLEVVEEYEMHDSPEFGQWTTFLATNRSGNCKVWVKAGYYGLGEHWEVESVVVWLPQIAKFRGSDPSEEEYVYVLGAMGKGSKLPPVFLHDPIDEKKRRYPVGAEWIKILNERPAPESGWTHVGELEGEKNPPYSRDHLSGIWETIAIATEMSASPQDIFEDFDVAIHRESGEVWVHPKKTQPQ